MCRNFDESAQQNLRQTFQAQHQPVQVHTALLRAIGPEASADLMSNLTGQVHKPFEFDMDNFIKEKAKLRLKY